jgi:F-type H+-transporting ATPase subunit a
VEPIHQFEIKTLFPIAKIGNVEIAFTNSALYMLIAVGIIALLMLGLTSRRAIVPGRFQAVAEMTYEFIATMLQRSAGREGMKFFPLVFSLFMFILVLNIIALIPHSFAVMAQIIITASLALLVFFTVIIYGFWKHGFRFLKLFVPSGVPIYILPMVTAIEVLSFLSRPLSHSVRLFANILAGHITLYVFAAFVTMLGAVGILGWRSIHATCLSALLTDRVKCLHCMNDPQLEGHMASYIGRRKFLATLGGTAAAWPVASRNSSCGNPRGRRYRNRTRG